MSRDRKSDQHRAAGERKAGRKLGPDETIHHLDENKKNNADANLAIKPRGKHTADHNRGRGVSKLKESLRMQKEGRRLY